jgi:hypothetical protein
MIPEVTCAVSKRRVRGHKGQTWQGLGVGCCGAGGPRGRELKGQMSSRARNKPSKHAPGHDPLADFRPLWSPSESIRTGAMGLSLLATHSPDFSELLVKGPECGGSP